MKSLHKKLLPASIAAVAMLPSTGISALALEEVVVTATKRSEGLQDVPIAISVVDGEKIEQMGITDLSQLALYMPSVHIGESGGGGQNQIFIRGVGSGNNTGFEQSVGMFIDGVYYGRARNANAAFLDLERVEVLKGPQSTLFGKNTIAGAINITSGQPKDEFEAYIDVAHELELDGTSVTGMVTGPLSDKVRGRLVAKTYETDGWMENTLGEDGPANEFDVIRGTLAFDVTSDLTMTFKAERGEFERRGTPEKIDEARPLGAFILGETDPGFADTIGSDFTQSIAASPGRETRDETDSDVYQLTAEYTMGEHTLRSITAHTSYDAKFCSDTDVSSLAFIDQCRTEKHSQFSQEFLLSSPSGGEVEYLMGIYYQNADLEYTNSIGAQWSGSSVIEPSILALVEGNLEAGLSLAPGALAGVLPSRSVDGDLATSFDQDTETVSAFAEMTWNITEDFRTTFGLRYSRDEKNVHKTNRVNSFHGVVPVLPGGMTLEAWEGVLNGVYTATGFFTNYEYELDRTENHVTGNLNFQYDINDDVMAYLNFGTGYKAGGFDANNNLDTSREYDDESVETIELGFKMELWDNRARVNVAFFDSTYEDVQVSSFQGATFIVTNAAESRVRGLEVDFQVALTDKLMATGGVSWLDAEYESYPGAACTLDQVLNGPSRAGCTQDLGGTPLQFAPDVSGNLALTYSTDFTDSTDLDIGIDFIYSDDVLTGVDNDPVTVQENYTKINARIALLDKNESWSLAVVGKNITDKATFNWANDLTLSGAPRDFGLDGTYFHSYAPPRTIELQARYNF